MGDIFLKLLNMSIAASWLILAVLLLRLLLKKTPKWIHCLLWGFVAVRLICPFSIESAYSLIPSAETVQTNKITDGDGRISQNIPVIDSRMPVVSNVVNPILRETFVYEEEENAAPMQVYTYAAGIVWCCGVLLLLTYAFIGRLRIRNMVKEAVCHRDNIYLCDAVESPFIFGVIRPHIYLPSGMEADMRKCDYVIAHEQAHLKRKDYWWKPLGYLLLAVYWFNPLCWIAYVLLCRDIEFACDEKVIRDMSLDEKKEYSKALLSCSTRKRVVMICPLAFGEISVKMRIKSVLDYKKAPFIILLAAVVICVIVGILFMTNPPREYQIRVMIPAGSTEPFAYSDEEICPKGSTLTIYAGEGLGDAEIVLLPMESKEEKVYAPAYITPGMPVKFEAEKGAWYKIGVNAQNPTDENRDVYVSVNNVDVRIANIAAGTKNDGNSGRGEDGSGQTDGGSSQANSGSGQTDGGSSQASGGLGQTNGDSGQAGGESESAGQDMEQGNKESTDDIPAPRRYDLGDLDGNGEMEYMLITYAADFPVYVALAFSGDAHLSFYFNGESIYEYDDLLRMYPGDAEYIDLDSDGEPEIFFTLDPQVNSLPLIEYAVLKRTGSGWKALEMIHGETMLDNAFPISSRYGKEENTIVISCEGLEKEIVYNITAHYEARLKEYEEYGADSWEYQEILNILDRYGPFETGDDFGEIALWGIWDIKSGIYEGKNCLIATHGLDGPVVTPPYYDTLGEVDIYFNYNEKGLVNILNMEFREWPQ